MTPGAPGYLASHRAHALCAREVARITDAVIAATAGTSTGAGARPSRSAARARPRQRAGAPGAVEFTVRQSPDRCIVQRGPVALTLAWLRDGNDLADARLLAIVWRGIIAARGDHIPERRGPAPAPQPPVALWEAAFAPTADGPSAWRWSEVTEGATHHDAAEIAALCMDRFRLAHDASLADGAPPLADA